MFSGPDVPREGPLAERRNHLVFAAASILVGVSLFLPRPMNFSPVGALGLFSGAYAARRTAWLYPLAALTLYVLALGEYPLLVLASVYIGFALPAWIAAAWIRGRVGVGRVTAGVVLTSTLFFLVSNLGSWLVYGIPRGESLAFHYVIGLPLFWNTLAGDLTFSAILFGGYAMVAGRATGPDAGAVRAS